MMTKKHMTTTRAQRAIAALREPDHSLARVPNTIRESIAEVIEDLLAALSEVNRGDMFSDATIILEQAGHPQLAKAMREYRNTALAAINKGRI